MTTKEISAKELQDLDPKQFEKEYQEWAQYAADYEWWNYTYEYVTAEGRKLGFVIDDIRFSGFWSQGDGACWDGSVRIPEFIEAHNLQAEPQWFVLGELVKEFWIEPLLGIYKTSTQYAHSGMMRSEGFNECNSFSSDGEDVVSQGPLMGALVGDLFNAVDLNALEEYILEAAKDYADGIYKQLQDEYDYLTSEESFIEHCEANEVMFEITVDEEEEDEVICKQ